MMIIIIIINNNNNKCHVLDLSLNKERCNNNNDDDCINKLENQIEHNAAKQNLRSLTSDVRQGDPLLPFLLPHFLNKYGKQYCNNVN